MSILKIFLLEDEAFTSELLKHHLELNPDNEVTLFNHGKDLLNSLLKKPDLILLDYNLDGENGGIILKKILERIPDVPVVMISGQEDIAIAVGLLKDGAHDYIVKDENMRDRIWAISNRIRNQDQLKQQVVRLQSEVEIKFAFSSSILGESKSLRNIYPMVEKACQSTIVVSISGETGTDKEVLAKTIHFNSSRKNKPFVAINMAAIPKELLESELFGHEKGSFTGANEKRIGKFEEANGGTIFLDEIGELELALQAKLLRVLQEQQITRIGGNKVIQIDARIIIATHKNLFEEVNKGNFREDLYYRLLGITIDLPPLRERGNDIALLAQHFVLEYCNKHNISPKKICPDAMSKLYAHSFPGNIRELKSIIELAVVLSDGDQILPEHLQIKNGKFFEELLTKNLTLRDYNEAIIKHYMKLYHNRVRQVADKLNIGKSTIYRLLGEAEPNSIEDATNNLLA
ncbi:MAG: sigma-54-dependent Fis family transcriptional regulator [Flavobacteriales bacterium]|nr:sigma-54-dependent Fis family transcriptional regulator [Flavobacteriales bacterium]